MGLRAQLQKLGHSVVGQAANGAEAEELYLREKPNLALVDIRLQEGGAQLPEGILYIPGRKPPISRDPAECFSSFS
jgi:DNA-binding NarL/FixJ family response regulator